MDQPKDHSGHKGLLLLDVDGVLFKRPLLLELARRRGPGSFFGALCDGILFDIGRISTAQLLRRTCTRLRGMRLAEVWDVYRKMPLMDGIPETIKAAKEAGRCVILLTAGVPTPIVKDLVARVGADDGAGMDVTVRNGRLTDEVTGELIHAEGKRQYVQRLVERDGISWDDVVVVGDDPNNLPLMERAGVSIGFRATYAVRKAARYLVEGNDLSGILPYVIGTPIPARHRGPWIREIYRKSLHLLTAAVPLFAGLSLLWTSLLMLWSLALYFVSEVWRVNGASVPVLHPLARSVMRPYEVRAVAMGPITLALGVCFSLWCLPRDIGFACILIAGVADSTASVIGGHWGRTPWPHNRYKTVEGTAAFFLTALVCAWVYVPLAPALTLALIASTIESLPMQDWDNFFTPVGTGFIAAAVLNM